MGCPPDVAASSVRFSLSFETTAEEIDEAVTRIARTVNRLRGITPAEAHAPSHRASPQPEPIGRNSA
jgi:cysteine sulfinate desulfinase/cysteine desulfurase-like protein